MSDLEVGVQLLTYAQRVNGIIQVLADASTAAHAAADCFAGDAGFYEGRARLEMKQFFDSYAANVDKLAFFESAASQFLVKAFNEFKFTDTELASIVAMWLGDS